MRGQKGILHNLGILTGGQVVAQLANVAALVYLADFLGPHWFGVVQIGVAFMGYALISAEWGMMALGTREISRLDAAEQVYRYTTEHHGLMIIQTLVVLGLGLFILPGLPFYQQDPWVFLLYLGAIIPQLYTMGWVAMGLERMTWVGTARIVRSLVYALLIVVVLRHLGSPGDGQIQRWVPAVFLLATSISNLVVLVPLTRLFGRFIRPQLPAWTECRRRWFQTSSIGANTVVLRILINIDLLLLGVLASPEEAGNYAAAAKVMFVLVIAVEVLWSALLPRLARQAKESTVAFRTTFNLFFGTVAALLAPIALGGWLLGPDIVALLYGNKFIAAGPVFQVLALSYAMLALSIFLGQSLLASDRQRWYLIPLILSSVTAVLAIRLLVPVHGGLGASWGILAAHGLLLTCLLFINMRLFNRPLLMTLAALVPALGALAFCVLAFPQWHVLMRVACGGAAYLGLAIFPLWTLRRVSQRLVSS